MLRQILIGSLGVWMSSQLAIASEPKLLAYLGHEPRLVASGDPAFLASWIVPRQTTYVAASRYLKNDKVKSGWQGQWVIENSENALAPKLCAANGSGVIVWFRSQSGVNSADGIATDAQGTWPRLWVSFYERENQWSAGQVIPGTNAFDVSAPVLACNSNGHAFVSWVQKTKEMKRSVWVSQIGFLQSVKSLKSTPFRLDSGKHEHGASEPSVSLNSAGKAIAVWTEVNRFGKQVFTRTFDPQQGWSEAQSLDADFFSMSRNPQVFLSNDGTAIAAWLRNDSLVARYFDGHLWHETVTLQGAGKAKILAEPKLSMNAIGMGVIAWIALDLEEQELVIRAAEFLGARNKHPWGIPQKLNEGERGSFDSFRFSNLDLKVNSDGTAFLLWSENYEGSSSLYFYHAPGIRRKAIPILVHEAKTDLHEPKIAVNKSTVQITWEEQGHIFYKDWSIGK